MVSGMLALYAVLLVCASCSMASRLQRRASTVPPPAPFFIPLIKNEQQRYTTTVKMGSPNPQSFQFALSTNTGLTVVAGNGCGSSCQGVQQTYDASSSTTAKELGGVQDVAIPGGSASGRRIKEDCNLVQQNGTNWFYPNQTIVVANQSSSFFSPTAQGLLGLGTNAGSGSFADTIYGQWRARNPTKSAFTFGMALNPPQDSSSDGGVLHWVNPDSSAYQGVISYRDIQGTGTADPRSDTSDWVVNMDSWSFNSGTASASQSGGDMKVTIDPYLPSIVFPADQAKTIYGKVPGAALQLTSDLTQTWTVPCNSKFSLSVSLGDFSITLTERVLLMGKSNNGSCTGTIQGWAQSNATTYFFGSSFISAVYLIAVISGPFSGQLGFANRIQASKKLATGAIAGISLGAAALVGLIILVVILLVRRHRKNRKTLPERPARGKNLQELIIEPYDAHRHGVVPGSSASDNVALLASMSPPVTPNWNNLEEQRFSNSQSLRLSAADSSSLGTHYHTNSGQETVAATFGTSSPPPYSVSPGSQRSDEVNEQGVRTGRRGKERVLQV